ncbi:hypothetical protein [Chitinophaga sp. Cy-1792]|uniref:hypothetical protein n=1 Tax=Chitinophaga sp. Cy-1792 TaxID=2608339 RepID=UPI001422CA8B|nr:hypothetical protein [Chitinophaga sp. Cy-1792]NIG56654.1 hypothetical protein [Chitinophaga sp. Cy-1792]
MSTGLTEEEAKFVSQLKAGNQRAWETFYMSFRDNLILDVYDREPGGTSASVQSFFIRFLTQEQYKTLSGESLTGIKEEIKILLLHYIQQDTTADTTS